ncbi:MAG: vWA domain-containing protein [Planctomycetota bacterium]
MGQRLDRFASNWKGDGPGWLTSLGAHLLLLVVISVLTVPVATRQKLFTLAIPYQNDQVLELPPQQFTFDELDVDEIGAESLTDNSMDLAELVLVEPEIETDVTDTSSPLLGSLEFQETLAVSTGVDFAKNYTTRGQVGVGMKTTRGAVDRLTHEILLSLEERPTLVVWLLDQSPSLIRQRAQIRRQLKRVYRELGAIQATGTFDHYAQEPLLSSVIAFGETVDLLTDKPTADVKQLEEAFASIPRDDSGIENIYATIAMTAKKYRSFRRGSGEGGAPLRNVMIIGFTDEAGDDQRLLEDALDACSRYEMPVYIVGVPAPFGQVETFVKWIDPDPNYDQTPQWAMVNQGPETLMPERVKLAFAPPGEYEAPLDSGFGPFGLTRLAYETGGIYFALHPNRDDEDIQRRRVQAFTAHISKFFDEEVMRRYQPDYVAESVYRRRLNENRARAALVTAAQQSWIHPMEEPQLEFVARDVASLVEALTEAQKTAAKLEPVLDRLYQTLRAGEPDRSSEQSPRWQAGYDLAFGRTLATLARTRSYNAMLAQAKRGMPTRDERNNTWTLHPHQSVEVNSQLQRLAEDARTYLQRVIDEHPDTPWATLAARELARPLGWRWEDSYTLLPEDIARMAAQNGMPRDDRVRMLPRRPTRRDAPRL